MIYTAESWFGAGTHIYDRPGGKNRFVEKRHLRADGAHVDRGSPSGLAVTPDGKVYTVCSGKVSLLSADDKLLEQVDWANCRNIDVAPDGKVYSGNRVLEGKAWKDFKYYVLDIAADGRMLVRDGAGWGIYNPAADKLDVRGKYPVGFNVGDAALGPAGRVYLTSRTDRGLAFAAIDADGKVLFQRGTDFDRLQVTLPGDSFAGGQQVAIRAATIRSRDLGFVPAGRILPEDNRPTLEVQAALTPAAADPLAPPRWTPCTLAAGDKDKYAPGGSQRPGRQVPPADLGHADERARRRPLAVTREVTIVRPGQAVFLQPTTDRKRTAFAPGRALRLTVPARASADVDLSQVRLELRQEGKAVWSAPLGLAAVAADKERTAVVIVPAEVTSRLRPRAVHGGAGEPAGRGRRRRGRRLHHGPRASGGVRHADAQHRPGVQGPVAGRPDDGRLRRHARGGPPPRPTRSIWTCLPAPASAFTTSPTGTTRPCTRCRRSRARPRCGWRAGCSGWRLSRPSTA